MHYDCRYVHPVKQHERYLVMIFNICNHRLSGWAFTCPDEKPTTSIKDDAVDNIVNHQTIAQSMFLAWFDTNKKYPHARELAYYEFPTKFVEKQDIREWVARKKNYIERIFYIYLGSGEIYYLRLLPILCGPTCYNNIRCINGV